MKQDVTFDVRRGPLRLILLSLAVLTVIAGPSFLLSPIGRRLLANPAGAPPQVGVTEVHVVAHSGQNHAFDPPVIQIPVGTTVAWHFEDVDDGEHVPHNIVGEDFVSPVLAEGTFSYTFTRAGSYPYTCTLHPFMDGRVEVIAP